MQGFMADLYSSNGRKVFSVQCITMLYIFILMYMLVSMMLLYRLLTLSAVHIALTDTTSWESNLLILENLWVLKRLL